MTTDDPPLLEVRNIKKYFTRNDGIVDRLLGRETEHIQAVDDVSFRLEGNRSIGLIGESGCGKTTLLRTVMGMYEPTAGEIFYKGWDVGKFNRSERKEFRRNVQAIFQDPFNSLDPKFTVRETVREPLKIHGIGDTKRRIREALERVELHPVDGYLDKKPAQLSGGERQRVSIARSLVSEPELILADEPVSMLDVSIQASILNLLSDLIEEMGLSLLYISHDLSTVTEVCDTVNVMYRGRIIESASARTLIREPKHPYSQALIKAVPIPDPHYGREHTDLEGAVKDPINLGEGCRFRGRCPEIIPPPEIEIEQATFREVMNLRKRIESGEIFEWDMADANRRVEEGQTETVVDALQEMVFETDLSAANETVVREALKRVVEDDQEGAAEVLRERFESICEKTPEYLEVEDGHYTACHLYYDHAAVTETAGDSEEELEGQATT